MGTPTAYNPDPARAVIALRAGGGYVSPDYAFLNEVPYLTVFGDGRILRQEYREETAAAPWMEGRLQPAELEALLRDLDALGFWAWDSQALQAEVQSKPLITDLPTTALTVALKDKEKTVSCYGLRQYLRIHALPGLAGLAKACDRLEALVPDQLAHPAAVELFGMPVASPSTRQNSLKAPWPLPEFPFPEAGPEGQRTVLSGDAAKAAVDVLAGQAFFAREGAVWVIRYRPQP